MVQDIGNRNLMQILLYLDFGTEGESASGMGHNSMFFFAL